MTSDPEIQELLKKLSANETRLGESISAITSSYISLEIRVKALEAKEQNNEIIRAREDERDKALYKELDAIKLDIKSIKGLGKQSLWVIWVVVLTAIAAFIIKGGLTP